MPFTDSIKMVDIVIAEKQSLSATPSDVASGKNFIGSTQHIEVGTLPVIENHNDVTIVAGESYNVPNGLNKVPYNVKAETLDVQTPANATADDMMSDKTAWVNGEKITGNILDIGAELVELEAGETHIIPRGFHNGSGTVTAKNLASQTSGTAIDSDVLAGSTYWCNGEEHTGTMPNNGSLNTTLDAGETLEISEGFYGGGTVTAKELSEQTQGTANAGSILAGKTAWVNGQKVTGNIPNIVAEATVLPLNGEYVIPLGYHNGLGTVTQNIPTKEAQVIGPTKDPQTIEVAGYYMEGNITITGVDALNYRRTTEYVKDSAGEDISNYTLTVASNSATIRVYTDNWHDNATFNVYHAVFSDLIDANGNSVALDCLLAIDYQDQNPKTYTFGNVSIVIKLEEGTNAHTIIIHGITSGKITLSVLIGLREFGADDN